MNVIQHDDSSIWTFDPQKLDSQHKEVKQKN